MPRHQEIRPAHHLRVQPIAAQRGSALPATAASLLLAAVLVLPGCASTANRPFAKSVCVNARQQEAAEEAYLHKHVARYLRDYGFVYATESCDIVIEYIVFGALQSEEITKFPFWTSRNGYWIQEGISRISYRGVVVLDENQILERGYSAKQDLLEGLAWALVKPVIKGYSSTAPTNKPSS